MTKPFGTLKRKKKIEAGKLPEDFDYLRSFIGISRSVGN